MTGSPGGSSSRDPGPQVLVVEDDPDLADVLSKYLRHHAMQVDVAGDGTAALEAAAVVDYDVVVLDVMLPGIDGFEVCRRLRSRHSDAYVLMVTARGAVDDVVEGLAAGADDYVPKPFSPRELVARIEAVLRRPRTMASRAIGEAPRPVSLDVGVELDTQSREVRTGWAVVPLTGMESHVLEVIALHRGLAVTRRDILDSVWGPGWVGDDHVVDVHVANLRRKLTAAGLAPIVSTVRSVGYRLAGPI